MLGMGLWKFVPLLENEILTVVGLGVASLGIVLLIPLLGIHTMFLERSGTRNIS